MHALTSLLFATTTLLRPTHSEAVWKKRLTGEDLDPNARWFVAGTDLGIPYILENGAVGYFFGDTYATARPEQNNDWRSPVMLRSAIHPAAPNGVVFDSAAGVLGDGHAPELMHNGHNGDDGADTFEITVIPNDAISFPETGRHVLSYMSIRDWHAPPQPWRTNYAGLAVSDDGNRFMRICHKWWNDHGNADPFQMWSMQRDGDFVYIFSVRSGRQQGPMMLQRVLWNAILDYSAYEGWGWDGTDWAWGHPPTPILEGWFSEPSVRKLNDGTWVMVYLNVDRNAIVSRTARGPDQPWSDEVVQISNATGQNLYGGFVHPWSTSARDDLHLLVSQWSKDQQNNTTAYHVSQYFTTI
ncbi:hypothetical protein MFIFM68171_02132 [Madurella fahalii]|uniref:DUF4185 domain-containing protein n=1 Tax=Madurella fahalii TaxID=1157608 RepID=A0ABQ0G2E6_9PEZI